MTRLDQLAAWLRNHEPAAADPTGRREAAVALIWVPDPETLLLIRRAEHPADPWSGQMGLPGGRRGTEDPDLLSTVMRESGEEIGVDLAGADLLGALDDLAPTTPVLPPILVRPFVFRLPTRPRLITNAEVAATRWVELDTLLAPGVYGRYPVNVRGARMHRRGYRLEEGVVWGMTERILTPVLRRLTNPIDPD